MKESSQKLKNIGAEMPIKTNVFAVTGIKVRKPSLSLNPKGKGATASSKSLEP